MLAQGQVGLPSGKVASGTNPIFPAGSFGELLNSRLFPDYYMLVKAGLAFTSSIAAVNATAFVGGAAGTPLIGIYNPLNSGKDLVLLEAMIGARTTGTGAATLDFNHWAVSQTTPVTGTATPPRNLYSMGLSGSVATVMQNTANTAALASALLRPSVSIGAITITAGLNVTFLRDEIKGEIIIAPGNYYAFGASATTTAASFDVAVMWAEIPV